MGERDQKTLPAPPMRERDEKTRPAAPIGERDENKKWIPLPLEEGEGRVRVGSVLAHSSD
jgi:hypothetical protein